jgi:transcription elongation factor GreA
MADSKRMSERDYKELQDKLEELKVVKRKEIAQKLKEARAQGDLSENAEYDAAKEDQRLNEQEIETLEAQLKDVEIIREEDIDKEAVNIGSFVKLYDVDYDEEVEYEIVSSSRVNSLEQKISEESPLGRALLNKRAGDEVQVETPGGTCKYKVLEVTR